MAPRRPDNAISRERAWATEKNRRIIRDARWWWCGAEVIVDAARDGVWL